MQQFHGANALYSMGNVNMKKQNALRKCLELSKDEEITFEHDRFVCNGGEYRVLGLRERAEAIKAEITELVWAFNASFLSTQTDMPESVFTALKSQFEDSNARILKLIEKTCGIKKFIKNAIAADGYGHFLAGYDSEELEVKYGGRDLFIYRTN